MSAHWSEIGLCSQVDPLLVAATLVLLLALGTREWLRDSSVRGSARFALRSLAVLMLGAALLGIGRWRHPTQPVPRELLLLIDRSASMGAADDSGSRLFDRLRASWLSDEAIASLRAVANVSAGTVGEQFAPVSLGEIGSIQPDHQRSGLVEGVEQALDRGRAGHVVLLSDGVDTDERALEPLGQRAASLGVRLHAVMPGAMQIRPDARVDSRFERAWARSGESVTLRVEVKGSLAAGTNPRLTIREESRDGEVMAEQPGPLEAPGRYEFTITPRAAPKAGEVWFKRYVACIEHVEGDADPMNDCAPAIIQVFGGGPRILVIDGRPGWETRFFVDAAAREPAANITLLRRPGVAPRLRATRIIAGPEGITREIDERTPAEIRPADYDLFVFGDSAERVLDAARLEEVRAAIEERGAGALFLRGPIDAEAIGWAMLTREVGAEVEIELAHVRWSAGADEAIFVAPRLMMRAADLSTFDSVVATADEHPLVVERLRGLGRIGFVLGEGLWSASLESRDAALGAELLWRRLIRRLIAGGASPESAGAVLWLEATRVDIGKSVRAFVRTPDASTLGEVVAFAPGAAPQRVALTRDDSMASGVFTASIVAIHEGEHRVVLESASGSTVAQGAFVARDDRAEIVDGAVQQSALQRMASASGGSVWRVEQQDEFIDMLRRDRAAGISPPVFEPLLSGYWGLLILGGLLALEWLMRRRGGLA